MDPQTSKSLSPQPPVVGLVVSCALLALLIAPSAVLIAWLFSGSFSGAMMAGAALGGGISWLAAALALTTTFVANRLALPVHGMLVAMVFRMGLPLAAILMLPKLDGQSAGSIATTTILGTYLIALVAETALALRMITPRAPAIKAATAIRGN